MVVHFMLHQLFLQYMHLHLVLIVNDVNQMDNGVVMHYLNFVLVLNFLVIQQQQQLQQQSRLIPQQNMEN
jgi:hypothetical protein